MGTFIAVAGGLATGLLFTAIPFLGELVPTQQKVTVSVGAGLTQPGDSKSSTGGQWPWVAIYDGSGNYLGQVNNEKQMLVRDGFTWDYHIPTGTQGQANPEYIVVTVPWIDDVELEKDDGLCISYISVVPTKGEPYMWYGDAGYACGADWYLSNAIIGKDEYKPRCVWIDRDHSNGLRFQGLSVHMPDFIATAEKAKLFTEHPDLVCNSLPRMAFYTEAYRGLAKGLVFDPPLKKVLKTLIDVDFAKVTNQTGYMHCTSGTEFIQNGPPQAPPANPSIPQPAPQPVYDSTPAVPDDSLPKSHSQGNAPVGDQSVPHNDTSSAPGGDSAPAQGQTAPMARRLARLKPQRPRKNVLRKRGPLHSPGYLIKSKHRGHSARELCESPTSRGPDFISHSEGLFCDMEHRKLWPLCEHNLSHGCFSTSLNTTIPARGVNLAVRSADAPAKDYHTVQDW